jgi:hypothetical protein
MGSRCGARWRNTSFGSRRSSLFFTCPWVTLATAFHPADSIIMVFYPRNAPVGNAACVSLRKTWMKLRVELQRPAHEEGRTCIAVTVTGGVMSFAAIYPHSARIDRLNWLQHQKRSGPKKDLLTWHGFPPKFVSPLSRAGMAIPPLCV